MVYIEITETYEDGKLKRVTKIVSDLPDKSPSSSRKLVNPWLLKIVLFTIVAIVSWFDPRPAFVILCVDLLFIFFEWCNQK